MTADQPPTAGGKHRRPPRRTGAVVAAVAVVAALSVAAAIAVGAGGGEEDREPARAEQAASRQSGASSPTPSSGGTPDASATPTSTDAVEAQLGALVAEPMEAVEVSGRVTGVPAGTAVRVQLRHPDGRWRAFPLEPVVDESGAFLTYVEVGRRGKHEVRVVEPESDARSEPMSLRIG